MKRNTRTYGGMWLRDWIGISLNELKLILSDIGVVVVFFVAGLVYPLLYNIIYYNGLVEEMPVAVVDMSQGSYSRRYIQKLDATRECEIAYSCLSIAEARQLMADRRVHGVVYFPSDFDERIVRGEQASLSLYADMSAFLYYKSLTMASNLVMLDEMHLIQAEHYAMGFGIGSGTGSSGAEEDAILGEDAAQLIEPVRYDVELRYNRPISYTLFFIFTILLLIVQQTMFYGSTLLAGTLREEHRSFATLTDNLSGFGIGRVVLGRGAAYFAVYIVMGAYIAILVPWLFHMPIHDRWWETLILLAFFVTDCIFFSFTWSSFFRRRETVFVILLIMSPIAALLTGFSWPRSNFPGFWRVVSCIFPSTFGARAFMNLADTGVLSSIRPEIIAICIQIAVYYFLANLAVFVENHVLHHRDRYEALRDRIDAHLRLNRAEDARIIAGETKQIP